MTTETPNQEVTWLTTAEAAERLGRAPETLRYWRFAGKKFLTWRKDERGNCLYREDESEQRAELLRPAIGERVSQDTFGAAGLRCPMEEGKSRLRNSRALKSASRRLQRAAEQIGDESLEFHLGARVAYQSGSYQVAEFIDGTLRRQREVLLELASWVWDIAHPRPRPPAEDEPNQDE